MWRMDTLRWGTELLLAESWSLPAREATGLPHLPWRRPSRVVSGLVTFDRDDRSLSSEMAGHFAPKRVVTLPQNNWTLWPDVHNMPLTTPVSARREPGRSHP